MGIYERYVLPRAIDLACGTRPIHAQREKVVPRAHGRVLEIGMGSGRNLSHYHLERITSLVGLDPSPELRRIAERRARRVGIEVEWLPLEAERIPLDAASVDSVVVTYTFCTIDDTAAALSEIRRVLKPRGELYFSEHGRAPDPGVARVQDRLTPYWQRIAGGCRLNRDIPALLTGAGFELAEFETMYLPSAPRALGYTFWGCAKRAS